MPPNDLVNFGAIYICDFIATLPVLTLAENNVAQTSQYDRNNENLCPGGGYFFMLKLLGETHSKIKIDKAAPWIETNKITAQVEYSKGSKIKL